MHDPVGGIKPPPWTKESMLSYMDDAGIDVAITSISTPGVHMGDARFRPLFDELERRKAVVFVHPTASFDASSRGLDLPDTLIDFTADTTRAIAQMHYKNVFARTPNVKYIFSHAGGTTPFLAKRLAIIDEMNAMPGAEERGKAADTFRRLYRDTALSWSPASMEMPRGVAGMGQVLFGSDYPYLRRDLAVGCRTEVEQSPVLTPEESRAVMAGNALRLFPRLTAGAAA